jgi:hypothetical protein
MRHNFPYRENLYHQKILIVKLDALLKGSEKIPSILDP